MITILQPVVPSYRDGLFERMAEHFGPCFVVYASNLDMGELTHKRAKHSWQRMLGPIWHFLHALEWQVGAVQIPIARGDTVVICGNPRSLSSLIVLLKARTQGARVLWWGQYWSASSQNWRARLRLLTMLLADGILFYTDEEISEYCSSRLAQRRKPIFALNNGVETNVICTLRAPYKASERLDRLLFIGRITAKAEIGTLLTALASAHCRHIGLDVIGDGEHKEEARQKSNDLGLGKRVIWHPATTDERLIAPIANRCKAFVYPGSVGLSLIHGLAYGLPAIVHDDRWRHMPEIAALKSGVNGRVFVRGDATSLSHVIAELLAKPETLEQMACAAIDTTEASFNTADMARRFCTAIETIRAT